MKKEFKEVAKENIEKYKDNWNKPNQTLMFGEIRVICLTHKQTCQRFLEDTHLWLNTQDKVLFKDIQKKREDRKDTIKLYEESGIKCKH